MEKSVIEKIASVLQESESRGAVYTNEEVLSGLSGKKMVGALQRFAKLMNPAKECYLEVGVFQGLTLLSVAKVFEPGMTFGVDNFAQFDKENKNFALVNERMKSLGITNASIINLDFEEALIKLEEYLCGKKIGLYFVDGPHDYRSQLMCLMMIKPYLSENAVIMVDDSNYKHVRQANRDFLLTNPEFKLVFEAYTPCHPSNMTAEEKNDAREGWWDGVNIIVRDPENSIKPMFPPAYDDKMLFVNDNLVHPARYAAFAYRSLKLISYLHPFRIMPFLKLLRRIRIELRKMKPDDYSKYENTNTFSENLTSFNLNPSLQNSQKS